MAVFADGETLGSRDKWEDCPVAPKMRPVRSPRGDCRVALSDQASQPSIVVRANRIARAPQNSGIRRAEGEQIRDNQLPETPILGKADAPRNRAIVDAMVGRRGIEADEEDCGPFWVPDSAERVPVAPIPREDCRAFHTVSSMFAV